ncbi:BfmA/BtgA family mobilization protein [Cytophagaceae bacterium YF14B1]|uniref:BfmA/BtgA family mobilization protein n=1 Tax=Xanthocytophaga flava TaxID=3048013 RepID=A0AAE3QZ53_9BACT|nr:BfmA/BtgA family mobilization protein [Xanthocytophaga flavus]MDJ1485906.1 BfmA/BtgA family mobilization protein [Xanthocytophaga flavus]
MKKPSDKPKRPARRTRQAGELPVAKSGIRRKKTEDVHNTVIEDESRDSAEGTHRLSASTGNDSTSLVKPINVNVGVLRKSKEHQRQLGVKTLKEYSEAALLYFIKNGLNPTKELESGEVSVEVVKLRNQIFSFLQKQEQAYILPIFREVTGQNQNMEKSLSTMISQLEKVYELLYRINQMVHVSTSTTLHVSGLDAAQIEQVKEKNKAFVDSQVSEFKGKPKG